MRRVPRRHVRRGLGEARSDLGRAGGHIRRAAADIGEAGREVMDAGRAGVAVAREVADAAGERLGQTARITGRRVGDVAEAARDRVGDAADSARERVSELAVEAERTAVGLGERLFNLLQRVRKSARRTRDAIETTGARAAVSVIETGTKMLKAATGYVSELSPRRRVQPKALEQLIVEQLRWVHTGTEAYDRAILDIEDTDTRMQLVRYKLETIKHAETLSELLREVGGRVPAEERETPLPKVAGRDGAEARRPAAVRQGLAHALTAAVQTAEGWRALNRIALLAEQDRLCDAIVRARDAIGSQPEEQVEFLRQALLDETIEMLFA